MYVAFILIHGIVPIQNKCCHMTMKPSTHGEVVRLGKVTGAVKNLVSTVNNIH